MPVRRVKILLRTEGEKVPSSALPLVHLEGWQVAKDSAIDRIARALLDLLLDVRPVQRGRGAGQAQRRVLRRLDRRVIKATLVEDHEQRGKLAIDIRRRTVRS